MRPFLFVALAGLLSVTVAHAHSQSSSRLYLDTSETGADTLSIDLALVDLTQALDLDRDADGSVTWRELTSSDRSLVGFVTDGVRIAAADAACRLTASSRDFLLTRYAGAPYLRVRFGIGCPAAEEPDGYLLRYSLFFDINPAHRALVRVTGPSGGSAWVLSPDSAEVRFSGDPPLWSAAAGFVVEGVRHILSGYDHLVFLLLLILPAAGRGPMRARIVRIGVIVTAFTVAHSITLAAATLGLVRLPAGPVEIGIAASIVVAAAINVLRPAHTLSWKIAFAFGLLHGFGFAGALAEMNLGRGTLLVSLLSFNAGVEIGQLLVVAVAVPMLALLSVTARYRSLLVPSASLACGVLGATWIVARL